MKLRHQTLFPYTTLFRSVRTATDTMVMVLQEMAAPSSSTMLCAAPSASIWPNMKEDRKSTRLNSSHVAISYALFCLKKKILHLNGCSSCHSHLILQTPVD